MNSTHRLPAQARQRLRRTAGLLVDDSSLRDCLTDTQAQRLLDWGMACLALEATGANDLSDEDAMPILEAATATVRRVLRLVNLFMSKPLDAAGGGLDTIMDELLRKAGQLAGNSPEPARLARAEILGRDRLDLDDDAAFERIMALITFDTNPFPQKEVE
jgi:hypothetical protein